MSDLYWLTDEQMARLEPFFPKSHGKLPTTYLNDVRFDLRQGAEGVAYITDSNNEGIGGIIVIDIASGRAIRRL